MSRFQRTVTPQAVDRDGVAQAQTLGGAGALTLNGALASGGVATFTEAGHVSLFSAGNLSGITFTVTGTDRYGQAQTETLAGPGAGATVLTVGNYKTVTAVSAGAAVGTNVEVGSGNALETAWIVVDRRDVTSIAAIISSGASLTYGLQVTYESVFTNTSPAAFDDATMTGKTANFEVVLSKPIAAIRAKITGYTSGSLTLVALQPDA